MENNSGNPEATERVAGPSVDIVIVNWNSRSLLRECLAALDQSDNPERLNIIVVDNASSDGSTGGLAVKRVRIDLVLNDENRGFAAACNQGARRGAAPFLLFVNPDVRVKHDTVAKPVRYLDDPAHSDVGVLGIQLLDSEG